MCKKKIKSMRWHKWCPSCKSMKSKSSFNKHKNRHDGLQSNCRDCMHLKQKEWSKTHMAIINYKNIERNIAKNYWNTVNNIVK